MRPIRAVFNRQALVHNAARARQLAPDSKLMAILKANAYGHGLVECARSLNNADAYGVLDIADAQLLRSAGITQRICLLEGLFRDDNPDVLMQLDLEPVIHSQWQIEQLKQIDDAARLHVWLKVDTGMGRLGISPKDISQAYQQLEKMSQVESITLMSHLSNADELEDDKTSAQLERLTSALPGSNVTYSLANSAGICGWPATHLDWIRPGIMLYGSSPLAGKSAADLGLEAVMSLRSEIISIRSLQAGDSVGYGSTWLCPEAMCVGIIACGYGDGYPRHAAQGTPVAIDGRIAGLIGRVSMDMIAVDLRGHDDAKVGSIAEMWGTTVPIDEVADSSETIAYELMCGITARVARVNI